MSTAPEPLSRETKRIRLAETAPKGMIEGERWQYQNQWIYFDPFDDLNACAQIEATLTDAQWIDYHCRLNQATIYERVFAAASASPATRAEALGLALGLWQPGR